jgi:hypothetical protein
MGRGLLQACHLPSDIWCSGTVTFRLEEIKGGPLWSGILIVIEDQSVYRDLSFSDIAI